MKLCLIVVGQAQWERVGVTCDSAHSLQFYSAASLGHQTCYLTHSLYLDIELTSPCPNLTMLRAGLGSAKYQFLNHWFDSTKVVKNARFGIEPTTFRFPDLPEREANAPLIRPSRLVLYASSDYVALTF